MNQLDENPLPEAGTTPPNRKGIDFLEPDFTLRAIVDLCNKTSLRIGITLNVGGFLISGIIRSGRDYFAGIAAEAANSMDKDEDRKSIHDYFDNFGKLIYPEESKEEQDARPLPVFIHLSESRAYHPSGKPTPNNRGVWWRGRLTSVDGWNLGNLRAD